MKRFVVFAFFVFACTIVRAEACTQSQIDLGNNECVDAKFSITTTNLSADTTFKFKMSAAGVFYVDWGDGTVQTINRTGDTTEAQYTHTYATAGVKTIRFAGLATEYNSNNYANSSIRFGRSVNGDGFVAEGNKNTPELIASMSGSLTDIFPHLPRICFRDLFAGATNLTNISPTLLIGYKGSTYGLSGAFFGCSALTSIPADLFKGIVGTNAYYGLFERTFEYCTNIISLPDGLFANITNISGEAFYYTFINCSNLTSVPADLFGNISNKKLEGLQWAFTKTFRNDVSLSQFRLKNGTYVNYIPPQFFGSLDSDGFTNSKHEMDYIFYNTGIATTCPSGTTQYITGYESYWDGKVSCVDESFACVAGEYLPAHGYQCETCPKNSYCIGGNYNYSESTTQGISGQCENGYSAPAGSSSASDCVGNTITVRWDDGNGGAYTTTCSYGGTLTTPSTPPVAPKGYHFTGWSFNLGND